MPAPFKIVITEKSDAVLATGNILDETGTVIIRGVAVEIEQPLLKAAPELLEALEMLIVFTTPTKRNAVVLNKAYTVIAKALGDTK